MEPEQKIEKILTTIPDNVKLLAVSKTKPVEKILSIYNVGQRLFGENRTQELMEKNPMLPGDIKWHMIGHLQTNKVKFITPFISVIQSVDSLKLLKEINKEAEKCKRTISCFLQIYIAKDESKFGFDYNEAVQMLESVEFSDLKNIKIEGVMGMATYTDDLLLVRNEFKSLRNIFGELKRNYFSNNLEFSEISMGMSSDYMIAIEEGSTMVRLGSILFGNRY
jgi:PLP dependent protein